MSYVFFDLEWNQGYPRGEADRIDEIIQIGAYRLDNWSDVGSDFSAYVRPAIHKKLHHQIKKILPLDTIQLRQAEPFPQVIDQFFRWCGDAPLFFTWGNSDARVLDMNLCWYGMGEHLDIEIYDLQRAFDLLVLESDQQASLKDAVCKLALGSELAYHDAGNDAYYTAMIGVELVRRFGALPDVEELSRRENALRAQRRAQAKVLAETALQALTAEPLLVKQCGSFKNEAECLKSRSTRVYRCPECENWLCNGNWHHIGGIYVARSRCGEHGRYYTCLRTEEAPNEMWKAEFSLYTEEAFGGALFHLCKQGGEPVVVCKMPKKRTHYRKRSKTNEAKKAL